MIASGGAGELEHLSEAIADGRRRRRPLRLDLPLRHLPRARGQGAPGRRRHPRPALGSQRCDERPDSRSTTSARRCATPIRSWRRSRAAAAEPVYLVGGAVRDLLLGRGRADIDLVVEGDAAALAARLGAEPVEHERFATAKVELDGHEVDIATRPVGDLSAARRAAGGDAGRRASRPTSAAATSRSTRWRSRCAASRELIDPHGGAGRPRSGPAAGPARALLRRRPDPGDPRRPLRGPLRLRAGAGDRASCCARPTSARSRRTAARRSCCGSPANRPPPRGVRAARRVGADRACARAGSSWPGGWPSCSRSRPGRSRRRATAPSLAAALGPAGGEASAGRGATPQRPSQAVELAARPRPASSWSWPGRWAPSGSTTTWASGAGSSSRSTATT